MTFNTKFNMCQLVFAIDDGKIKTYAVRKIIIEAEASKVKIVYGLEGYVRKDHNDSAGTKRSTAIDDDLYMSEVDAIKALKSKGNKNAN